VEWKAAAGEEFPTEDVKERVIFASFFEHGFNLPTGDFFRGLLYYYKLELVNLVLNSITVVATFIHFWEAYLGISSHFLLWRYLLYVKSSGMRSGPVGVVLFSLRSGLKAEWMDSDLPGNTAGWRSEWFYIVDQLHGLQRPTGHKPVKISEWDLGLSSHDLEDLKGVLELFSDMKKRGVTRAAVARSFCWRLIQPIKDRVLLTPKFGKVRSVTCGSNAVRNPSGRRKVSSEEFRKRVRGRQFASVRQENCCADFAGLRGDVARAEGTNGWISDRI
jgi:hypothetical protein